MGLAAECLDFGKIANLAQQFADLRHNPVDLVEDDGN